MLDGISDELVRIDNSSAYLRKLGCVPEGYGVMWPVFYVPVEGGPVSGAEFMLA